MAAANLPTLFARIFLLHFVISAGSVKIGAELPTNAIGCKDDWSALLSLNINGKDIPREIKYLQTLTIKEDQDGYVLIKTANSVMAASQYGNKKENQQSFWAFFKCNKETGKLIHDHCRVGDLEKQARVNVPLTKYFRTSGDKLADGKGNDQMDYICRESTVASMKADVVPRAGDHSLGPKHDEDECERQKDSKNWCGVPAVIETEGCVSEWNILQKGNYFGRGRIQLRSSRGATKSMILTIGCEKAKLITQECQVSSYSIKVEPGFYLKKEGLLFACPGKDAQTAAQIAESVIIQDAKAADKQGLPKGLKPMLPDRFERCESDWDTLTQGGKRHSEGAYVEMVESKAISPPGYDGGDRIPHDPRFIVPQLWIHVDCPEGQSKLQYKFCRVGEDQSSGKLSIGSFHVVHEPINNRDYFFNCGDGNSKTTMTATNAGVKLTRTEAKMGGLTVQKTLNKI